MVGQYGTDVDNGTATLKTKDIDWLISCTIELIRIRLEKE